MDPNASTSPTDELVASTVPALTWARVLLVAKQHGVVGDERCAELLETVPNFETLFERKTTEEVGQLLDTFLSTDGGTGEVERFGTTTTTTTTTGETDAVEAAFNDLLNS